MPSDDDEGAEPADDERYRDMLAAATGRQRDADALRQRRRRRDVLVSEAYPESEYNVSAQAATAGGRQPLLCKGSIYAAVSCTVRAISRRNLMLHACSNGHRIGQWSALLKTALQFGYASQGIRAMTKPQPESL